MRIVHVVNAYPPGAGCAARWCQGAARALAARGLQVEVLALGPGLPSVAAGTVDLDHGVRVRRLPPSPPLHLLRRLRPGWRARRATASSGALRGAVARAVGTCDVVHLHGDPPHGKLVTFASRLAGRPIVHAPHLHGPGDVSARIRWIARRADALVAVNPGERSWLNALGLREPSLVSSGDPGAVAVDAAPFPIEESLVAFLGAGDWQSGAAVFVDAVRLLRLAGQRINVAIISGSVDELLARLWRASAVPVLELHAASAEARGGILRAADAIVLPRDWCPGMAAEGWMADKPVLAPMRSAPDAWDAGVRVFPPDDPIALSCELDHLLGDPAAGRALVSAGRARREAGVEWPAIGEQLEAIYRSLLDQGRRSRARGRRVLAPRTSGLSSLD